MVVARVGVGSQLGGFTWPLGQGGQEALHTHTRLLQGSDGFYQDSTHSWPLVSNPHPPPLLPPPPPCHRHHSRQEAERELSTAYTEVATLQQQLAERDDDVHHLQQRMVNETKQWVSATKQQQHWGPG